MTQTMLRLRDYQTEAVDAVFNSWDDGMQRPAEVLPTGSGKTVIFSHLAVQFIERYGKRLVILVHRDELADQTLRKLAVIAPTLDCGKVKAADNNVTADVIVASVQTLARPNRMGQLLDAQAFAGDIGLVIVDECHHAVAPSYRNIMAALGCYDSSSGTRAVGFTATLQRGDGRGLGGVWDDVVFTRSILWMISRGHLTDIRARTVDVSTLDLSGVRRSGGDYTAASLGEAMQAAGCPEVIRQVIEKQASDRRSVLVFVPTVAMAEETAGALRDAGLGGAAVVTGGTPREDRLLTYKRFASGEVRVLVNCMVLTEGADFPYADCAVIARPTSNETLFIQMVGRVLRPSPSTGKDDALVLLLSGQGGSIRTLVDLEPDVEDIDEGESLAEAYEREQARKEQTAPAGSVRFELKYKDLDLFKSSPAYQWLRTRAGVQFIPLGGNGEIMLWPSADPGLWDVVHAPEGRAPWVRLHTGLDLGMAQAWGESEAEEKSAINTGRSASWRKKRASEAQLNYAWRLGCEADSDMRAGQVGDLISTALASRKIDRKIARFAPKA